MKKALLFLSCFSCFIMSSQNGPIDFETIGNTWTWTAFEAGVNPTVTVIPNPVSGGINTSATVAEMTMDASAASWGGAGCESMHGADIGTFTFNGTNSLVKIWVYQVGFATPVALKFANATNGALPEVVTQNSVADQWVELSFDMSALTTFGPVDQIIFYPSYAPRATSHTVYFDNVNFGTPPPALTYFNVDFETNPSGFLGETPAIFSDYFDNPTGSADSENLSAKVGKMELVNSGQFVNAQINIPAGLDLSASDKGFSVKVLGNRSSPVKLKIEGSANVEVDATYNTPGQWQTLFFDFTSDTSIGNNKLVLFFDIGSNPSANAMDDTFHFDDVIFDQYLTVLSVDEFTSNNVSVYPNPTNTSWNIKSIDNQIDMVNIFDITGKKVMTIKPNSEILSIDASTLNNGLYFAELVSNNRTKTIKLIKE